MVNGLCFINILELVLAMLVEGDETESANTQSMYIFTKLECLLKFASA
jgi:hypothetical protein